MRLHTQGVALAVVGALGFSGKAILAKLMYRYGVDAVTVVAWRMMLALPWFLALAWWGLRGRRWPAGREWLTIVGLGFSGYYLASMLDFYGLQYISASLERLILYLGPTFVMILSVLVLGRRVAARQWWAAGLSYLGVVLVFGHEWVTQALSEPRSLQATAVGTDGSAQGALGPTAWGALLVLGSALSYSVYLLASGEVVQRFGSLGLTGLASSVACGFCLAHFSLVHPWSALAVPAPVLVLSGLNALACTVLPVLAVMMAIERIGASMTAQIGMVGPLSTIAMGAALLGETFSVWTAAGTALVLVGVTLLARMAPR